MLEVQTLLSTFVVIKKKKKIEIEREWLQEYLGMVLKRGVFVALEMLVIPFKWAVLLYYWYVL